MDTQALRSEEFAASTEPGRGPWWRRWEAPTWAVAVAVYAGWGLVTWFYEVLPWWLVMPLGAWFVCWQGSLQHEALHGHPTRHAWLNGLIAFPPLWLWLPYLLYRESHLAHHAEEGLTAPGQDPESYYVTAESWARFGPLRRALLRARNTLLGRFVLGPAFAYAELAVDEVRRLRAGDTSHIVHWLVHVPMVAAVLYWAVGVCGMPLWAYVLFFAYPGLSLTMLRSFAEHRPAIEAGHRTTVVEAALPFRLVFLNNNLHAPHHVHPGMAWYDLPVEYRVNRAAYLDGNGDYLFHGYGEQFRRFFLRPKDAPVHPFVAAPAG
jgi:fatty acid desaturase